MIDSWQQKQILKLYIYFVVKTTSSVELFEVTHRNFKMAEMTSLHMSLFPPYSFIWHLRVMTQFSGKVCDFTTHFCLKFITNIQLLYIIYLLHKPLASKSHKTRQFVEQLNIRDSKADKLGHVVSFWYICRFIYIYN